MMRQNSMRDNASRVGHASGCPIRIRLDRYLCRNGAVISRQDESIRKTELQLQIRCVAIHIKCAYMHPPPVYRALRFTASFSTHPRHPCIPPRSFTSARLARNRLITNHRAKNPLTRVIIYNSANSNCIFIIAAGCILSGYLLFGQIPTLRQDRDRSINLESSLHTQMITNNMSGKALPGRPGNLTKDQEVKLQELWIATLKVFGVGAQSVNGTEKDDNQQLPETSEKKKTKRSLFSRKHENEESNGGQMQASADLEDKYGQTKEFYQVLATQKPEDLRKAFWSMVKHDNPDALLLRFLRARKWDVQNALVMLISTMHWRLQEINIDDDVMRRGESAALSDSLNSSDAVVKKEGTDFLTQLRMGKSYFHGTDREERPMCFVRVRLHKQGEQSEPSLERFTVYSLETARLLLAPHVDTAVSVWIRGDANYVLAQTHR